VAEATTATVLRRSLGTSVSYGLLFPIAAAASCLLGVPPALAVTRLLGRQLGGVVGPERTGAKGGFFFVYVFVVGTVLAGAAGASVLDTVAGHLGPEPAAYLLGAALGASLFGSIVHPFAFTPLVVRDQDVPAGVASHAYLLAARAVTRLPVGTRVWMVLAGAACFVAPLTAFLLVERETAAPLAAAAAAAVVSGTLVPLVSAHHVARYLQVRDALDGEPLDDDPVALPAVARAAGVSAMLAGLAVLALVGATLVTPRPMEVVDVSRELQPSAPELLLPETDVVVRAAGQGVTVAARDGGGVGHVPTDCPVHRVNVEPLPEAPGRFRVLGYCPASARAMVVDRQGVRRDDDFGDRLGERTGGTFWLLLAASLFGWILCFHRPWRALQRARFLRSLASTEDAEGGELRALEGTLRTEGQVRVDGAVFTVVGDARVQGPDTLVVTLPERGVALANETTVLADGARVAVVARFDSGSGGGFRDGPVPWPAGARLMVGGRRAAAEALTASTSRVLALHYAALIALQSAAALVLALSW